MRTLERPAARRQLDKRLNLLRNSEGLARPPKGWIRAIREALGMTAAQMAQRLGVSQPRIFNMEKAEAQGSITLDTLERAAHALECRLVYAFVPRKQLEEIVEDRARALARKRIAAVSHSMALEDQSVDETDERAQLEALVEKIIDGPGSALWKNE
jgi:predicted DNA-binding mobile mystery protein A